MRDTVTINPTGRIDRRNLYTTGDTYDVISRENMCVIGLNKEGRKVKKVSGSDRFNSTSVGTNPFVSGIRYYTKNNFRKTFAYNKDGYIYFFDELGNTTQISQPSGVFASTARPCWQIIRVSDTDILYFSEGVSTGMFYYDGDSDNVFHKANEVTLNFVGMVSWLDRLWGFEEDSEDIYFSVNLEPTDFTDSTDAGQITVGSKRGSKIQQIIVFRDYLYIFKEDSIWRVNGRTPSEFSMELVVDGFGLSARHSLAKDTFETKMFLLGSDFEAYEFGGSADSLKLLTYNLALSGDLTKDLVPLINRNRMTEISGTYHNRLYRLSFVENGAVTPNLEYCYNTTNETDFLTRGNNVTCYIPYDRYPDMGQLFTGNSGFGRLMVQYRGLNWDNQASSPVMITKTQTKFYGYGAKNIRLRRVWLNNGILGERDIPIKTYIDTRIASSDATSDDYQIWGEEKNPTTMLSIASQAALTSRGIPRHANSKGQNFSFEIDEELKDRDFEFTSFECEIISKEKKRSHHVGV